MKELIPTFWYLAASICWAIGALITIINKLKG